MNILNAIYEFISSHAAAAGSVLGIIWMIIVKFVSNEKAGKIISMLQKITDFIPQILLIVSKILGTICEILANAIKSDGFLGKK